MVVRSLAPVPTSTSYARGELLGRVEPRLWTPPLRELTPDTSVGFDQAEFARDTLRRPADPWQEWLFIHAGELLPDGRPRFRIVLVLAARQNGKTEIPVILSAYWQFIDQVPLVLGTSTKLEYAKESWGKAVRLIERAEELADLRPKKWTRETNGEQESWTLPNDETGERSRYKIAASNEEGGRSLTVHKLICDELRQHHDYSAWGAAEEATSAVWDAQIWALSNAGDTRSVVLNDHRRDALEFIRWWQEHGNWSVAQRLLAGDSSAVPMDYRLGLFEWSSPEGSDPTDLEALAQANPNLGLRKDPEALLLKARRVVAKGGQALTSFMTESMCLQVKLLNPAIDPAKWSACLDPGDLAGARSRVALCVDVSPDGLHVTLAAAAVLLDNRVRVELVEAWAGASAVELAKAALPDLVAKVKPQTFGWFPQGPAAALATALKDRRKTGRLGWPPAGVAVAEIRAEVTAACMGFEAEVSAGTLAHSDDPLLNDHVDNSEPAKRGDAWVFSRKAGHCDALYAAAGAAFLARTLPTPPGRPRLIVARDDD